MNLQESSRLPESTSHKLLSKFKYISTLDLTDLRGRVREHTLVCILGKIDQPQATCLGISRPRQELNVPVGLFSCVKFEESPNVPGASVFEYNKHYLAMKS